MKAPWRKWKEVDGTPIFVWTGPPAHQAPGARLPNLPSEADAADAPMFTIFPGAQAVKGELPEGEFFVEDGRKLDYWSIIHERSTYDDDVDYVLEAGGVYQQGQKVVDQIPQINDDLRYEDIEFRGEKRVFEDDQEIVPYAVEAGYTLMKVPEAFTGNRATYYRFYVLDPHEEAPDASGIIRRCCWKQTPLRAQLVGAAPPSGNDPVLLEKVNRYRASQGNRMPLRSGDWADADLREFLQNVPPAYQNPDSGSQTLKRRLMR